MTLQELRNNIDQADQVYYNSGSHFVDDSVYDGWKKELLKLDPNDERHHRVGAPVGTDNFGKKVTHRHPMGSLDNVMNAEEFLAWHAKMAAQFANPEELTYNVSFKMDGGSVALYYRNGELECAATRGDGTNGEEITANAIRFQDVPRYVNLPRKDTWGDVTTGKHPSGEPFTGSVRGEVMLFNEDWKTLDPDMTSNPRNLGNGMTRRSSGEHSEHLHFVAFRLYNEAGKPFDFTDERRETESGMLLTLMKMGFKPVFCRRECSAANVLAIYQRMQGLPITEPADGKGIVSVQRREDLPFEIDGLVIKTESLLFQEKLGEVSNRPRAQIAFKFPPLGAETVLESVEWTIGHTGAIIPTANLNPVKVGGVTVSRALLCNMAEIKRLGVAIGDLVRVVRRGDVIPKIVGVSIPSAFGQKIEAPKKCPACGGKIGKRKSVNDTDSVMLYCLNPACTAQALGKIKTWVKKLDIQGLGDVYLEQLYETRMSDHQRLLATAADLYRLHNPAEQSFFKGVLGEARVPKILEEIEKKKELTLENFLGSLGIDGLGRSRVTIVREKDPGQFDTLEDWLSGKLVSRAKEAGLPNTAEPIYQRIKDNIPLINQLIANGVKVIYKDLPRPAYLKEGFMTFLITGALSQPKQVFYDKIAHAGHNFVTDYKKGVTHLVTADKNSQSSKMKKALKDGCVIMDEAELLAFLK
jgi:DNA ligase (NAD+)